MMTAGRQTLRTPAQLRAAGLVTDARAAEVERVAERYAIALTPDLARLIDPADPHDPIARQFVPDPAELEHTPGEADDPIGDHRHSPIEGLVHRYPDRVLLKVVNVCAVYCRFCFRREMVGPGQGALSRDSLAAALDYVREHSEIWEVILTGGDPLVLPAPKLARIVEDIAAIDHVRVLRVHTRVPVVEPDRITQDLVRALTARGKPTYVVLHANHPRELTPAARAACARLIDGGLPMLSQSVLLRGVNDDVSTLAQLMRAFVECRIKPYYLHHADLAPGTAHLRTTIEEGQALMRALRGHLSGLCQPTYVLDIPGGYGKSPIGPGYLMRHDQGFEIDDFQGERHAYPPPP
jgi:lysine 2,3-aminomutase